jgi:prepilin-type processing-associated H-X9-DG protein
MSERRRFWHRVWWEWLLVAFALALAIAFLFPFLFAYRSGPHRPSICPNNQKQITAAVMTYCIEHHEVLPRWETVWTDIKVNRSPGATVFDDPSAPTLANGYVYNSLIGGKTLSDPTLTLAANGVKKLDATTGFITADGQHIASDGHPPNVAFTQADLDWKRHKGKIIASFLDGHVEGVRSDSNTVPWRDWLPEKPTPAGL